MLLSGKGSLRLLRRVFESKSSAFEPDPARIFYGHLVHRGEVLDEVIVRYLTPDRSLTGEEAVEINCHGGVGATRAVLEALEELGARPTTQLDLMNRAIRAGRMTATHAEALLELSRARSELCLRILERQLNGALETELKSIKGVSMNLAKKRLQRLLKTSRYGLALTRPRWVLIAGPANSGKSSLFNALVGEERVLVQPEPGTTRDYITAETDFFGVPVVLVDTAGIQETTDPLTCKALIKTEEVLRKAHLVIFLYDITVPVESVNSGAGRTIVVANKIDLVAEANVPQGTLAISALEGTGLDNLRKRLAEEIAGSEPEGAMLFTERQVALISTALEATTQNLFNQALQEFLYGTLTQSTDATSYKGSDRYDTKAGSAPNHAG